VRCPSEHENTASPQRPLGLCSTSRTKRRHRTSADRDEFGKKELAAYSASLGRRRKQPRTDGYLQYIVQHRAPRHAPDQTDAAVCWYISVLYPPPLTVSFICPFIGYSLCESHFGVGEKRELDLSHGQSVDLYLSLICCFLSIDGYSLHQSTPTMVRLHVYDIIRSCCLLLLIFHGLEAEPSREYSRGFEIKSLNYTCPSVLCPNTVLRTG